MPAGARVLPYRSNIPKMSEYVFEVVDPTYAKRALARNLPGGPEKITAKVPAVNMQL